MKHFTIIELVAGSENPMIGTIDNIPKGRLGRNSFEERFSHAIRDHFDVGEFEKEEIPDLFAGSAYEDIAIEIDGTSYEIRIMETWMY